MEGENCPPPLRQSRASRLVAARDARSPLPEGEGQGEGERDAANQNGRTNFATTARPALTVKVGHPSIPTPVEGGSAHSSKGRQFQIALERRRIPLTPALSLGERENRPPLGSESNPLGRAGVSALNRRANGASGSDIRTKNDAACLFPLPAGEGQGEGERDAANQNGATSAASGSGHGSSFRPRLLLTSNTC